MKKIGFLILFLIVNIGQAYSTTAHPEAQSNEGSQKILPLGQDDGSKNTPAHQIDISYEKDLLSVHARSVNLKELFEEISKKTKIEVVLDKEAGEQKISVEFKELSLKEGIEKIIGLTGLKDLAISYNVGAGSKPAQTPIRNGGSDKSAPISNGVNAGAVGQLPKPKIEKIEIRKRNKEDIVKAKDDKQVKNREIVTVNKGKNDIPISVQKM